MPLWFRPPSQGIHIVTPNKKLNSGPLAEYLAVKQLQRAGTAHYLYEVRCAALRCGLFCVCCAVGPGDVSSVHRSSCRRGRLHRRSSNEKAFELI